MAVMRTNYPNTSGTTQTWNGEDAIAHATQINTNATDITTLETSVTGKVDKATLTAKGDLYVSTAAGTVTRLPVGATNGHALVVDSSTATGLKYSAVAAGGGGTSSGGWAINGDGFYEFTEDAIIDGGTP